ncbi:hypothetical protein SAMN04515671_0586 [Nakamurella panacisegetis]|uniref:Lysylphosphatidylglycerol synthase TM region n=1 Tax=Nakamurella panacisegetis TaxID=1090615 RepID=A0A1H0INZ8_9ACTN|nr:YbhN family protein [Nakamurella panacisegetis]SDO33093.1 hypothetical protein SAMN04515671_0586 [Nakamurella panacisegetis]
MTTREQEPPIDLPRVRPVRIVLTVLFYIVVIALLIWQRHRLAGLPELLTHAKWHWVVMAILAQVLSISALAREQRRLISVRGGQKPLPSVLATVYAGNAISISVPVIGSAAATVFSYRRFTAIGVDRAVAGWALAISGVYSTVSFAAIAAGGAMISGSTGLAITGFITSVCVVLPLILLFAGLRRPKVNALAATVMTAVLRLTQRVARRPRGDAAELTSSALGQLTSLRLSTPSATVATSMAALNWIADLACLVCAIMAVHGVVPWHGIVLAWAVGSGASSLNLTPGGLGVVEIALGAALVGSGLPAGVAVAGALLYRAVKLGLILVVGGITLIMIRRPTGPAPTA